jgi:membrane-bound lytic murein transglycosylase D
MRIVLLLAFLLASSSVGSADRVVVSLKKLEIKKDYSKERPWKAPNYSGQEGFLGYRDGVFSIPPELEMPVQFWVDIYTKYSTQQGVLHDSKHVNLVYEVVDFTKIPNIDNMNAYQKERAKERLVRSRKKHIQKVLRSLSQTKESRVLSKDEMKIWQLAKDINEKNKFWRMSRRGRLRFQLGQSDRFLQGIFYAGRYLEEMEAIFREEQLPVELTRLPFVESSFNIYARSKVGASGIWQFMRATGRRYMKVNRYIDERNDPILATHAAAKHLRKNYLKLNDWSLAMTAYNYGLAGMRRLARKSGAKNIVELIKKGRSRRFGFASKNFYASFLAALEVEKTANIHFGQQVVWSEKLEFDEIKISKPINYKELVKVFGGDKGLTRLFNPHLTRSVQRGYLPIPRSAKIKVEKGKWGEVQLALKNAPKAAHPKQVRYRVQRGDTLSGIAKKFRVPVSRIKRVNGITNPRRLRAGKVITIPK